MSKARVLASGYVSILTCNQRVPRVPVDQNDYKLLSPALEFFCPRKQHEFDEVCKILNLSKVSIHEKKRRGEIPFHRLGGRIYFYKSEVLAAMKKVDSLKPNKS